MQTVTLKSTARNISPRKATNRYWVRPSRACSYPCNCGLSLEAVFTTLRKNIKWLESPSLKTTEKIIKTLYPIALVEFNEGCSCWCNFQLLFLRVNLAMSELGFLVGEPGFHFPEEIRFEAPLWGGTNLFWVDPAAEESCCDYEESYCG
jgi:hypothetical protein